MQLSNGYAQNVLSVSIITVDTIRVWQLIQSEIDGNGVI